MHEQRSLLALHGCVLGQLITFMDLQIIKPANDADESGEEQDLPDTQPPERRTRFLCEQPGALGTFFQLALQTTHPPACSRGVSKLSAGRAFASAACQ